ASINTFLPHVTSRERRMREWGVMMVWGCLRSLFPSQLDDGEPVQHKSAADGFRSASLGSLPPLDPAAAPGRRPHRRLTHRSAEHSHSRRPFPSKTPRGRRVPTGRCEEVIMRGWRPWLVTALFGTVLCAFATPASAQNKAACLTGTPAQIA